MNKFEKVSFEEFKKSMETIISPENLTYAYNELKLPKRATKGSAGYDFKSPFDFVLAPGMTIKIPTGIKCSLNENRALFMLPRSSFGFKYQIQLDNTIGLIDQDYYNNENNEGHIFVKMTNHSNSEYLRVKQGDSFVQGIIVAYDITDDDEATETRTGGIGSTNNKGG